MRCKSRRQGRDRELGVLELFARLGPFAVAGEGERLPHCDIVAVADHGIGEILEAARRAADQDAGDRVHHHHGRRLEPAAPARTGSGWRTPRGFLIHAARHVEIGKIEPRLRQLLGIGRRRRPDQAVELR